MKAQFVKSYSDPSALPKTGLPEIALVGRSNAGKSSLINTLTGVKGLAKTSASPGLTKLINYFDVDGRFHLVDLPGYGFAKASAATRDALQDLILGYLSEAKLLKLVVVIVDSRLGPTDMDEEMLEALRRAELPFLIVATKVDKLSRSELTRSLDDIKSKYGENVLGFSAVTGVGKGELYAAMLKALT